VRKLRGVVGESASRREVKGKSIEKQAPKMASQNQYMEKGRF